MDGQALAEAGACLFIFGRRSKAEFQRLNPDAYRFWEAGLLVGAWGQGSRGAGEQEWVVAIQRIGISPSSLWKMSLKSENNAKFCKLN